MLLKKPLDNTSADASPAIPGLDCQPAKFQRITVRPDPPAADQVLRLRIHGNQELARLKIPSIKPFEVEQSADLRKVFLAGSPNPDHQEPAWRARLSPQAE